MPLGELKPRELTWLEKRWAKRWRNWEGMLYTQILPHLWHMSQAEYRAWVYAQDPRAALILATEPGFREVREYQLNKRWYHEWRDTVCRFLKR